MPQWSRCVLLAMGAAAALAPRLLPAPGTFRFEAAESLRCGVPGKATAGGDCCCVAGSSDAEIKGGRFRYPRAMAKSKKDPKGQATRILAAKAAAAKASGGSFSQAMGKLTLQKQARKPRG